MATHSKQSENSPEDGTQPGEPRLGHQCYAKNNGNHCNTYAREGGQGIISSAFYGDYSGFHEENGLLEEKAYERSQPCRKLLQIPSEK